MKKLSFNPLQMQILQVLWDKGKATTVEITEAITADERIPLTTVQSHLRFLEEKGVVAHDIENRTYIYHALIEKEKVKKNTLQDVIDQVFSGSVESLVLSLINHKYLSREELKKVIELSNEQDEEPLS